MKNKPNTAPASLDRRRFVATSCLGLAAGLTAQQVKAAPRDPIALPYERYVALDERFLELAELPGNEISTFQRS